MQGPPPHAPHRRASLVSAATRAQMDRWVAELGADREVRFVLPEPVEQDLGVPVVLDDAERLARAVDLPAPDDGGRATEGA